MIVIEIRGGRTVAPPTMEEVRAGANPTPTETCDGIYVRADGNGFIEPARARELAAELIAAADKIEHPPVVVEPEPDPVVEPEPAPEPDKKGKK